MTKDIFESDYFAKHRDNSSWEKKDSSKIHKYLNVKNKTRYEEPVNIPEESTEDILEEVEKSSSSVKNTQSDFMKLTYSGLMGALIVIIYSFVNFLGMKINEWVFWQNLFIVVLTGAIAFLILGLLRKLIIRR